ncbi:PREDICTED: LEAF RUST 10 DISEASE-RESISTANCE LOCUS RECEPTOR-LIKE PROTEIN KINASE-like 2.1 [Nelumbo nucifera]|uniref:non-specific serine/threonine protein kinase n=2 Tax=Nelumbo nucifera TaxID=4432 RepID=A0A1U8AJU3_NELNU|nr:PREDICTED: LEAF RUST 10 DISEASE-RESISTANCE LOCUS RECEPTOR-LIKE PROTEIN KINASE-like 2.1 [Nelumbo nucifera]DAD33103.1 TPA_asm: hypothetical protein HUJ06_011954 [Nelumbo nucifera]
MAVSRIDFRYRSRPLRCLLISSIIHISCCFSVNPVSSSNFTSCPSFPCGNNSVMMRYPFWPLDGETVGYCRLPGFGVSCNKNIKPVLSLSNADYYVESVNYSQNTLTVVNAAALSGPEQSCPIPRTSLSLEGSPFSSSDNKDLILYFNCSSYPASAKPLRCPESNNREANRSFVFVKDGDAATGFSLFDWNGNCESAVEIKVSVDTAVDRFPFIISNFGRVLRSGLRLSWSPSKVCSDCNKGSGENCAYDEIACLCSSDGRDSVCKRELIRSKDSRNLVVAIGYPVAFVIGGMILMASLFYCIIRYKKLLSFYNNIPIFFRRRRIEHAENIEIFLESYGAFVPKRYKYSDIKKMTGSFKDKLGQGGCGTVFKGKHTDGRLVAVKVLTGSKSNGDQFINEVASIGRTNHLNIVSLLGFCFEGSKRALVYEYMPNGSLEKFIYSENVNPSAIFPLGWQNLYQIALGIARGLEYLHLGCTMRILHFDIKPHNILLDKDFCPKISDFGLAKLCSTRESHVSLACARGTAGYIAPEFFFGNGGVSYKSDVFSYGVMVLEMVGGRKNFDLGVNNTSEIYFPHWIYDRLKRQDSLRLERIEKLGDEEIAKKMIVVGLWCIQIDPASRPSMSKVVEMLEGSSQCLQMPPKPPYFEYS